MRARSMNGWSTGGFSNIFVHPRVDARTRAMSSGSTRSRRWLGSWGYLPRGAARGFGGECFWLAEGA